MTGSLPAACAAVGSLSANPSVPAPMIAIANAAKVQRVIPVGGMASFLKVLVRFVR